MTPFWLLLGLAVFAQARVAKKLRVSPDEIEWPTQFTLKATRLSLTDNVIENYEIWRTSKMSRVDFNDGYVKSVVKQNKAYPNGIKYAYHPEAALDQLEVSSVCVSVAGDEYNSVEVETILPSGVDDYKIVGNETIHEQDCVKFTDNYLDDDIDKRNTVWAYYSTTLKTWVPVRYEVLEFKIWLGIKYKHEIWEFYDFSKSFSIRTVFKVDEDDCKLENETYLTAATSEAITKNLLFVDPDKEKHVDRVFNLFKTSFSRNYANEKEHTLRRDAFKNNMRYVIEHNRRNNGYKLTLNKFSDKTPEEMNKYMGLKRRPEGKVGNVPFPYHVDKVNDLVSDLPIEYDARLYGLVSKVKEQEDCGSCWTFGTTAAVEGALARINGGRLLALSNQALVDCAWAFGAAGCDGGTDNAAYEWMMEYGLPTEAEYGPYLNQDGVCQIYNATMVYPIRGYTDVTPLSIGALKLALFKHGPLSVSVDVTRAFQLYSSGIFYDPTCDEQNLNHEVALVGYGERDGETFWILKNSWGSSWGIGGFMYISARDNNCGVATEPTYVVF